MLRDNNLDDFLFIYLNLRFGNPRATAKPPPGFYNIKAYVFVLLASVESLAFKLLFITSMQRRHSHTSRLPIRSVL